MYFIYLHKIKLNYIEHTWNLSILLVITEAISVQNRLFWTRNTSFIPGLEPQIRMTHFDCIQQCFYNLNFQYHTSCQRPSRLQAIERLRAKREAEFRRRRCRRWVLHHGVQRRRWLRQSLQGIEERWRQRQRDHRRHGRRAQVAEAATRVGVLHLHRVAREVSI